MGKAIYLLICYNEKGERNAYQLRDVAKSLLAINQAG
jgi:hypothetical protein